MSICLRRKRTFSLENNINKQFPKRRLKRSKSTGNVSTAEKDLVNHKNFLKTIKGLKRTNLKDLQAYLQIIAKELEFLIVKCRSEIGEFKYDVCQPYNSQINKLQCWFSFVCSFIDDVLVNLSHLKMETLKYSSSFHSLYGIQLLSEYFKNKENDNNNGKDECSILSSLSLNEVTEKTESNKESKVIHSSNESSTGNKDFTSKKVDKQEHQDNVDNISTCSDTTEIYTNDQCLTVENFDKEMDKIGKVEKLYANYKNFEVCKETGYYVGGTVESSQSDIGGELSGSETQSYVFDLADTHSQICKKPDQNGADESDTFTDSKFDESMKVREEEILIGEDSDFNMSTDVIIKDDKNSKSLVMHDDKLFKIDENIEKINEKSEVAINSDSDQVKIDINEEKPPKIDDENSVNKESDDENVEINGVPIKMEKEECFQESTDDYEDSFSEDDDKSTKSDQEKLQKAYEYLQGDLFLSDNYNDSLDDILTEDSSSEESSDIQHSESPLKKESVTGQVVTLPLLNAFLEDNDLNDDFGASPQTTLTSKLEEDSTSSLIENDKHISYFAKKDFNIKDCSVRLEKLPQEFLDELKIKNRKEDDDDDAEIYRLMNLKSLDRKQTISKNVLTKGEKQIKKKKTVENGETDDFLFEDSSSSSDFENLLNPLEEIVGEHKSLSDEERENLLVEIMSYNFMDGFNADSTDSDELENNDEEERKKKKVGGQTIKRKQTENDKKKKKTSEWRNDPLLKRTFKYSSDSSDEEDDKEKVNKKIALNTINGDKVDDSDETDIEKGKDKLKRKRAGSSSTTDYYMDTDDDNLDIKDEIGDDEVPKTFINTSKPIVLSSSTDDSDIEFITNISAKRIKKRKKISDGNFESEMDEDTPRKKGRKNIRAVISDEVLEESTKKAIEEEKKRKERIDQRQKEINSILSQSSENVDELGLVLDVDNETKKPLVVVNFRLTKRLKKHQVEGVKFMWAACYESVQQINQNDSGSGCILAHCMGLGKTFQVITLIHTLLNHKVTRTKHVLIICPLSTVLNWDNEFEIAFKVTNSKKINVMLIGDQDRSSNRKLTQIKTWYDQGGVLIMGYEAYTSTVKSKRLSQSTEAKINAALVDPGPDLVVLDEGHLLKNGKNIRTTSLMKIKTKRRIILTGTPIQNNLKEYYHMVNFVKPNLLGSYPEYSNQFVNPIENGQFDDSTESDVKQMKYRSYILHKKLRGVIQRFEVSELETYLPPKRDYVLFIRLHPVQMKLYETFLNNLPTSDAHQGGKLFAHYRCLQNVCTHPHLLNVEKKVKTLVTDKKIKEIDTIDLDSDEQEQQKVVSIDDWWSPFCPSDTEKNIDYGPKLKVMLSIIEEAIKCNDKVIVFSNSLSGLDCIEYFLKLIGTPSCREWRNKKNYYRMDGTIKPECRMSLCKAFNDPNNNVVKVFLVSHKVGGLGLNLIAANRVILMDVNWNPAYDSQSIFRTYRFGQKKPCFVYRLVSLGTMEEVVYERSVTKLAIAGRVVDEIQINRHFKSNELINIFRAKFDFDRLRPPLTVPEDVILAKVYQKHEKELYKYQSHQALLENLPHESLTKEEMEKAWDEFRNEIETAKKQEKMRKSSEITKRWQNELRYQENLEAIDALASDMTTFQSNINIYPCVLTTTSANIAASSSKENNDDQVVIIDENNDFNTARNLHVFRENSFPILSNVTGVRTVLPKFGSGSEIAVTAVMDGTRNYPSTISQRVFTYRSGIGNSNTNNVAVSTNNSRSSSSSNNWQVRSERMQKSTTVPEVIDVEQHDLLTKLSQNHDISLSHILKPKATSENEEELTKDVETTLTIEDPDIYVLE